MVAQRSRLDADVNPLLNVLPRGSDGSERAAKQTTAIYIDW